MEGPNDIDSLEFRTRLRIRELIELTGETEQEALHHAVDERLIRLAGPSTAAERRQSAIRSLEVLWRRIPGAPPKRCLSRAEEDAILGYGPEGV